jgi:hypothetical protein
MQTSKPSSLSTVPSPTANRDDKAIAIVGGNPFEGWRAREKVN